MGKVAQSIESFVLCRCQWYSARMKRTCGQVAGVCDNQPIALTSSELSEYAKNCGTDVAVQYVVEQTGIDPRDCVKDGSPDWIGCSKSAMQAYTGVDPDDLLGLVDEDGNIDWQSAVELAGSIGAVALCTAYGLGAAAAICGKVGGAIAGALAKVGAAAVELFASIFEGQTVTIIQPDAFNCAIEVQRFFAGTARSYTVRVMALRTLGVMTLAMLDKLSHAWPKLYGTGASHADIYKKLVEYGLRVPNGVWGGWKALFCADSDGGWVDGVSPPNTRYRYNESIWSVLKTLSPPVKRFWWDIYSGRIKEDPGRDSDIEYRLNTFFDMEKSTPTFFASYGETVGSEIGSVGGLTSFRMHDVRANITRENGWQAFMKKAKEAGLLDARNYNADERSSHWLFLCSGSNPLNLACVKYNNKIVAGGVPVPFSQSLECKGHTVMYVAADPGVDYWCLEQLGGISNEQFEKVKATWLSTLQSSVQMALAGPSRIEAMKKAEAEKQAQAQASGWGTALVALLGLGAAGGLGYSWYAKKWPFAGKRNPTWRRYRLVGDKEDFLLRDFIRDNAWLNVNQIMVLDAAKPGEIVTLEQAGTGNLLSLQRTE